MLYGIAKTVAFRRQRKYLTAFLISRVVVTGAGHVDRQNRYRLSSKAMAIDTVTGFGGYWNERPIFVFHHWLQQLCGRSLLSRRSVTELFHRSQRLQIGLSDSNVSDTAEFLKVGTTSLVLDLIEAGGGRELPRLLKPIEALHRITSDWDLIARVKTTQGEMSGLDIQRRYYQACRQFVSAQALPTDHEAHQVLERWDQALEALAAFRSSAVDPRPALGHIDWLTKKWMLDHLEDQQPAMLPQPAALSGQSLLAQRTQRWAARKKVDIRYHELSEDGYFARLRCSAPEVCLVDPAGIEFALRLPPSGSPASRRGQLIREFAGGAESLAVDWSHVVIGTGRERRVHVVG
jgi:proteasome accessory factor A